MFISWPIETGKGLLSTYVGCLYSNGISIVSGVAIIYTAMA